MNFSAGQGRRTHGKTVENLPEIHRFSKGFFEPYITKKRFFHSFHSPYYYCDKYYYSTIICYTEATR